MLSAQFLYWAPRFWYQFEFLFLKFLWRPRINIAAAHVKKHQECNMHNIKSFMHRLDRFYISNKRKPMIFVCTLNCAICVQIRTKMEKLLNWPFQFLAGNTCFTLETQRKECWQKAFQIWMAFHQRFISCKT